MGSSSGNKGDDITMPKCIEMVEKFFEKIGLNPVNQRIQNAGVPAWTVARGSASIYVSLHGDDGVNSLRIFSPILFLPAEKLLLFYRKCLEINHDLMNCALCAQEDKIALVSQRPIEGLDPEELEGTINYVAAVADSLDNELAREFGARMYGEDPGKV